MKYVCQGCGDTVNVDVDNDPWDCVVCGEQVVPKDESEVVPKEDLRALVEEWREEATEINQSRQSHAIYANGKADAIREKGDELEELIE